MLEFYAGRGNLSRYCKLCGLRTGSLDILYQMATARSHNTNPMNLLSTSGFACLGAFLNIHVFGVYRRIHQHFLVRVYRGVKFVSLAADCIYIHIYIYTIHICPSQVGGGMPFEVSGWTLSSHVRDQM